MSQALATQDPNADPFAAYGEAHAPQVGTYLQFSGKTGRFTAGRDADEVQLAIGHQLAINMDEFRHGWICWTDSTVAEERMTRLIDGPKCSEAELPDHGPYRTYEDGSVDGWSEQASLPMRSVEEGLVEYLFKTSSASGVRALGALCKEFAKGRRMNPGRIAIVELDVDSFIPKKAKKVGKIFTPVFKVKAWATQEQLADIFPQEPAGEDTVEAAVEAVEAKLPQKVTQLPTPAKAAAPAPAKRRDDPRF